MYYFRLISIAHDLWMQVDLMAIVLITIIMSFSCLN